MEPKLLQSVQLKRRNSTHSSDDENPFFMMQSDSDESSEESEDSRDATSEEELDSLADETLYRKKYIFLKKMAKSIIFVSSNEYVCCVLLMWVYAPYVGYFRK